MLVRLGSGIGRYAIRYSATEIGGAGRPGGFRNVICLDRLWHLTGPVAKIAWSGNRGTPYVPSPLLYDGLLYFNQSNNAILSAYDAKSGKRVIQRTRMPELQRIYASPVGAAGRIYFIGRSGAALVIERGSEFKILAKNRLDEGFDASPALVGEQLFLRGRKQLYCISSR